MNNLLKTIRDKVSPLKTFAVEVLIHSKTLNRYIGRTYVTKSARSTGLAIVELQDDLRLHIGKVQRAKEQEAKAYTYRKSRNDIAYYRIAENGSVLTANVWAGDACLTFTPDSSDRPDIFDDEQTMPITMETFELKYTEAMKMIEI